MTLLFLLCIIPPIRHWYMKWVQGQEIIDERNNMPHVTQNGQWQGKGRIMQEKHEYEAHNN